MKLTFTIPGEPQGKARPRVVNVAGHSRAYTPKQTVEYENLVRLEYERQGGEFFDAEPVAVTIVAWFGIPKGVSKRRQAGMVSGEIRPVRKPDTDNVAKLVCDALNGLAYKDDAQVVDLAVHKYYSTRPRVDVTIETVYERSDNDD